MRRIGLVWKGLHRALPHEALPFVRDLEVGAEHLERALSLDPSKAWAWNRIGWVHVHGGKPDLTIQKFERAMRLSPFDPAGFVCCFGIADANAYPVVPGPQDLGALPRRRSTRLPLYLGLGD